MQLQLREIVESVAAFLGLGAIIGGVWIMGGTALGLIVGGVLTVLAAELNDIGRRR